MDYDRLWQTTADNWPWSAPLQALMGVKMGEEDNDSAIIFLYCGKDTRLCLT